MNLTQSFFIGNKPLGSSKRALASLHEHLVKPNSYAYFCPHCGDIWARAVVVDEDSSVQAPFQSVTRPCERHFPETTREIPGAFFLSWDKLYNQAFPVGVIAYELNQALKHYKD